MSIEAMAAVLCARLDTKDTEEGDGIAKAVLLAIANHTRPDGKTYPGMKRLCIYTGFSDRAVRSAVTRLEKGGWLTVQRRKDPNNPQVNLPNRYFLNLDKVKAAYDTRLDEGVGRHAPTNLKKEKDASLRAPQAVGSEVPYPPKKDARASVSFEDWQPDEKARQLIREAEGLSDAEIERELKMFKLKCLAGQVPDKVEPAFRMWCARVKDLKHEPKAPAPSPAGPPQVWDRAAKVAALRRTRNLYERMGRDEDIPDLDRQITALEAGDDDTTHTG